jgi:succinate dehydrogenase / fumarate reductase cytochrome b subunit
VTAKQSFAEKNHFLIRRLHSLTGIVPIGVFLAVHLTTNSSLAWGRFGLRGQGEGLTIGEGGVKYFQHEVSWINNEVPHLILIEIVLWVSIAFHSILGIYYATTGKANLQRYAYQDNWRYTLQRWSGYIGILFIFYHVATLRWGWTFLIPDGTRWSHNFSASTLAAAMQGSTEGFTLMGVLVSLLYFAGVTMLVFHFANGLWTAAITWGLTISEQAQKRWGYVCAALGAGLMLAGWSSLGAALVMDYDEAHAVEREMFIEKYGEDEYLEYLENKGIVPANENPDPMTEANVGDDSPGDSEQTPPVSG